MILPLNVISQSNDAHRYFKYRYLDRQIVYLEAKKLKYSIQFNTIKSKDSFLSIRTNKYKPSDYHYTNLGSKSSSFKKSTSIDTAVNQFCDIQNFSGQKSGKVLSASTKAAIRRCLSVPSIKIDTCSNRCGNCSGESIGKQYRCGSGMVHTVQSAAWQQFEGSIYT